MGVNTGAKVKSVPARSGRSVSLLGCGITLLDEPAENDDALLLFEGRTASAGMIPPHREENHEAFYILEGEFELEIEGEPQRCEAGDFLSIQPGVLHEVRNIAPDWGRIMFVASPGRGHQRFFETLGEPLEPGADPPPLTEPPDFERIAAVGRTNGIHFLPPAEARG